MTWMPRVVAMLVGAAGLMLEVLWIRVAGFAMQGLPGMFAVILAMYLLGVAVGARLGRRLCHGQADAIRRRGAWVLLLSGVVDLAALALFAWQVRTVPPMLLLMPLVLLTAVPKSALFPVAHTWAAMTRCAGRARRSRRSTSSMCWAARWGRCW